jgi:hypothetical protein
VKKHTQGNITFTAQEIVPLRRNFLFVLLLFADFACTQKYLVSHTHADEGIKERDEFLSLSYNHFEGGVFFSDVEFGLNVLWKASFKKNNTYKENLGFFVPGGLLILPNRENTYNRAKLSALPTQLKEGNLFVMYKNTLLKVLGIIHTHPDIYSIPIPAPKNDYQYCYLGIHNYIMDHRNLFDAYKDSRGRECYKRLGARIDFHRIPFVYSDTVLAQKNHPVNYND